MLDILIFIKTGEHASKYTLLEYCDSKSRDPLDILRVYKGPDDSYIDHTIKPSAKIINRYRDGTFCNIQW